MLTAVGLQGLQLKPLSLAVLSLLGSAIDAAVGILSKYGGSLWVSDPAYTFAASDGTGVTSDGSDAGYVRDLCATYGAELVPAGWVGINSSFTNQGLSVVKTADAAADTMTLVITGTAAATYSDPINNLLASQIPTNGGEVFELSAAGSIGSIIPAGVIPKLQLVEMTSGGSYIRGTLVPFGSKAVVAVGTDCRLVRVAVFVGNWATGAAVNATFTLQKPSLRQIIGRPLFQATTGFKPKLKRVPKKLGPELAPATTSTTGWTSAGAGVISSDGVALTITNGGPQEGRAQFSGSFKANTAYTLTMDVTAMVNGSGAFVFGSSRIGLGGTGAKSFTFTPTASLTSCGVASNSVTVGDGITFKNISVREVLEWGWAWVFDGTDDLLATVSQPAITGETFIAASKIATASVAAAQALMSKRTDINGSFLRRETTGATAASVVQADGVFRPAPLRSPDVDLSRHVYTQKITASLNVARLDGVQSGQIGCAPNPVATSIQIGAVLAARLNGEIYAAAYAPAAIPDAELLIVEQALGQLAGLTL